MTVSTYTGRTSVTSGKKCRNKFWMPCLSVAVEDGQPEQAPFMCRNTTPSLLRPRFLSPSQYRFLQQRAAVVLRAFRKAHRAALADDSFLAQFGLSDWERELAHVDSGFRDASPVSRLDAFFVAEAGGLRFTEYNAETPAGGAYNT